MYDNDAAATHGLRARISESQGIMDPFSQSGARKSWRCTLITSRSVSTSYFAAAARLAPCGASPFAPSTGAFARLL